MVSHCTFNAEIMSSNLITPIEVIKIRAKNKIKDNIGEAMILAEFVKNEIPIALPFGDNERYDLIAEFNGKLNKIQVKYCNHERGTNDTVSCPCASSINHTSNRTIWENYKEDVDYLAYYIPKYGKCLLIPIEYVGNKTEITINFSESEPTSINGKSVHWYKNFTFDNYF